jgi:hypothetical protein
MKSWKNGNKYLGNWKNDKRNGLGTFRWSNGDRYIGYWKDNQIAGIGQMVYYDEDLRES